LAEPGSDKHDGSFAASIAANDTLLNGTWESFKPIEVPQRKFSLVKKTFTYNPNAALDNGAYVDWTKQQKNKLPAAATEEEREFFYDRSYFSTTEQVFDFNASVDSLTTKSVANLTKADLFILRNSTFMPGTGFRSKTASCAPFSTGKAGTYRCTLTLRPILRRSKKPILRCCCALKSTPPSTTTSLAGDNQVWLL